MMVRKRRAFLFAQILVLALAQPAQACRGPFSGPDHLHLFPHDQVFLGTVESISDGPDPFQPTKQTRITTIRVERAWQSAPPRIVSIAYVSQNVGCVEECVCTELPVVGEKWLVVTVKSATGLLSINPKTFRIESERIQREAFDILSNQRGSGFIPQ